MNGNRGKLLPGTVAVAIAMLTLVAVASAEKPVLVPVGNVVLAVNGGHLPRAVSRTVPTPATFGFATSIRTADGSHPPALRRLRLETDKDSAIDVRGLPTCGPKVQRQSMRRVEQACANAVVGGGMATFEIAFPEPDPSPSPIPGVRPMIISNGGVRGAVTTLYARADVPAPIPVPVVLTIKITEPPSASAGPEMVISIPKVAGGNGSLRSFSMRIGGHPPILTLKCPDRKVRTRVEASFEDGTVADANLVRTCVPKP